VFAGGEVAGRHWRGGRGMLWKVSQFPELEHLEPGQRAAVLRRVPWWTYWVMVVRAYLLGSMIATVVGAVGLRGLPWALTIVTVVVVGVTTGVWYYLRQIGDLRGRMREQIAIEFSGRRPPFCFGCGYDLRGSGGETCPECGARADGG
jgi:hypothetical protein